MFVRSALVCVLMISAAGVSRGQCGDSWLMKNYRFTGPPPAGTVIPTDPVISELSGIQSKLRAMVRRAYSDEYYDAALAAAAQASSNAQLMGVIGERLAQQPQAATAPKTASNEAASQGSNPPYLIALKDLTIDIALAYWQDRDMLNYITVQGSHVIVRMDQVDFRVTNELNRQRKMNLHLPQ